MLYEGRLLFTGNDHRRRSCLQVVANELVDISLNQLTINNPCFFGKHIPGLCKRGRLQKNIPWRTPVPRVSSQLPIGVVWRLGAIFAHFRFADHRIRRAGRPVKIGNRVAHAVFTNADNAKSLILVFLLKTRCQRRFVTPVRTPGSEVNNHDELFAGK